MCCVLDLLYTSQLQEYVKYLVTQGCKYRANLWNTVCSTDAPFSLPVEYYILELTCGIPSVPMYVLKRLRRIPCVLRLIYGYIHIGKLTYGIPCPPGQAYRRNLLIRQQAQADRLPGRTTFPRLTVCFSNGTGPKTCPVHCQPSYTLLPLS
jgi:hypothetical protein